MKYKYLFHEFIDSFMQLITEMCFLLHKDTLSCYEKRCISMLWCLSEKRNMRYKTLCII